MAKFNHIYKASYATNKSLTIPLRVECSRATIRSFADFEKDVRVICLYEPRCDKHAFCICQNKSADQLHCNCAADQHIIGNTIPQIQSFKPLAVFWVVIAQLIRASFLLPSPEVIKKSCSTQMSMKINLLLNVNISRINSMFKV